MNLKKLTKAQLILLVHKLEHDNDETESINRDLLKIAKAQKVVIKSEDFLDSLIQIEVEEDDAVMIAEVKKPKHQMEGYA